MDEYDRKKVLKEEGAERRRCCYQGGKDWC